MKALIPAALKVWSFAKASLRSRAPGYSPAARPEMPGTA
jgi:hypothetical protein